MDNQRRDGRKMSVFVAVSIMLVLFLSGIGIGLAWGATLLTDWENASKICCECVYGNNSAFGWIDRNAGKDMLP